MSTLAERLTVLIVGAGGREHALAAGIADSPSCARLIVAPGNAGTPGERWPIAVTEVAAVRARCRAEGVDLVVIGPEAALAAGLTDALLADGVAVFGPTAQLARLETSKSHARAVAAELGIPGPHWASFTPAQAGPAREWLMAHAGPVVVKQSGLAGGKGVVLPDGQAAALSAVTDALAVGEVVLEERLTGPECSLIAVCDGRTSVSLPIAADHKRLGEGDSGPNTGGMGAYAPVDLIAELGLQPADLHAQFIEPVVTHLAHSGRGYVGALYAGLILTPEGPRLLEFNCRLGDPEAQVLLPLLDTDLLTLLHSCAVGHLTPASVRFRPGYACGVVLAAPGYPTAGHPGLRLSLPDPPPTATLIRHSGTECIDGEIVGLGGRMLTCVGLGSTLAAARAAAYEAVDRCSPPAAEVRRDIGWRAAARAVRSYAAAGVDIAEGDRAVSLIAEHLAQRSGTGVLRGIGAFGGAVDVAFLQRFDHPVLVASTDGVGSKVELAAAAGRLDGIGADLVHHCVNDVLAQGARPLFFLDYLAADRIVADQVAAVVAGIAVACAAVGCALIGGETAEMPGVYAPGRLDVAGTIVGVVERSALLPRADIAAGDVLLGLAANGAHTNGYTYLRRLFDWLPLTAAPPPLDGPLIDALLLPHRCYLPVLEPALQTGCVKALVHVTGGGLPGNLPRVLPPGLGARVDLGSWPLPPLFTLVHEVTALDPVELHRTLNMGIGMVAIVGPDDLPAVTAAIDEPSYLIGEVTAGAGVVLA